MINHPRGNPRVLALLTPLLWGGAREELVEDVEGSLVGRLSNGTRLLQQVCFDVCTGDETRVVEVDSDEFALICE